MKSIHLPFFALIVAVLASSASLRAEEEQDVSLSDIPQAVLNAAMVAVPGIVLTEAEVESTEKGEVYELEGEAGGKEYEIHIAADGTVIGVEADDDEHDDDHDDDDDDDQDDDHQHDHDATETDVKKDDG